MIADLRSQFRAYPVATVLELGSLVVCVMLFAGTLGLLTRGPPTGTGTPWLILVGLGAAFVVFWTGLVPLYERVA